MTTQVGISKVSQNSAMFVCHRDCCSEDKLILICHVNSKDCMIKGLFDFMAKSASK